MNTESAHTRVFLTGFMGSGKSTVGAHLASKMGYTFVDLDHAVEDRAGMSVQTIFETRGEAEFRALETDCLEEAVESERVVIALGGGAFLSQENQALVAACGVSVWLDYPVGVLAERLEPEAETRPLLLRSDGSTRGTDNLEAHVASILRSRADAYGLADIRYLGRAGVPPRDTAAEIVRLLEEFGS